MNSPERCSAISPNMGYEALARDGELLLAARSGSHAAFAELQRAYSHRVYQRILSITLHWSHFSSSDRDTRRGRLRASSRCMPLQSLREGRS